MKRSGPIDRDTEKAVHRFIALLADQYDIAGAILYGSRAPWDASARQ